MSYNIMDIRKEFIHTCCNAHVGMEDATITLNPKFTGTLGRVTLEFNYDENRYYPTKVEFNKTFIENAPDNEIHDVILHEAAHFIVTARTGEDHKHDKLFKKVCLEIGGTNNTASTTAPIDSIVSKVYKYTVVCPNCHKKLGGYSRMCKTLRNLNTCKCLYCNHIGLEMEKNW